MHVSQNRLEGSLSDTSLTRLLDSCRDHAVTGTIQIEAGDRRGAVELRAGVVEAAAFGGVTGGRAVEHMRGLRDGMYELTQRLPDLDGALGTAAEARGESGDVSLVELMRHCEDNALTCTITLIHDFDRGEIQYRAGELVEVTYNGTADDDKIVDMVRLRDARFRIAAPPLNLAIEGWPKLRRDRTEPFHIGHLRAPPRGTSPQSSPLPGVHERPPRTAMMPHAAPRRRPEPEPEPRSRRWSPRRVLRRAVDRQLQRVRARLERLLVAATDHVRNWSP